MFLWILPSLQYIRGIRKYLTKAKFETLIHAFISSRLDYFNNLLHELSNSQLSKLQRVQNASTLLVKLKLAPSPVDFKILLITL